MSNAISLVVGGFGLILVLVAFFPLLGWANWFILPVPVVGAAIGAISVRKSGLKLNLVVLAVGVVRLILGGGIF